MTLHPVPKPRRKPKARPRLKARKPMKRYNVKRGGHKFPKLVDEARRAFVRTFPCCACIALAFSQREPTQACHLKSRGAGGADEGNLWPGCATHHAQQHLVGVRSFQKLYHFNLARVCERIEADYVRQETK